MTAPGGPKPLDIRLLDGELLLWKRLGYGMLNAQIFRGAHERFGDVVCKIIPVPPDEQEAARMRQYVDDETDCGKRLRSPHIRRLHDHGVLDILPELHLAEGAMWLVFEWVPETLDGLLGRERPTPIQVLRLASALTGALMAAHRAFPPIAHRDLKPQNVLVFDAADLGTAKLADFGIARMAGGTKVTSAQGWTGTELYMAPEQFEGSLSVGPAADLYALGLLLWQCLTGEVPLRADGLSAQRALRQNPSFPELVVEGRTRVELRNVLRWVLHPDPTQRPESAERLLEGLRRAGETDELWSVAEATDAMAIARARDVPRVLIPPDLGSDERATGGQLTLRLPIGAAGVLERLTTEVEWTYSLRSRSWSTVDDRVGVDEVTLILRAARAREEASEPPAEYRMATRTPKRQVAEAPVDAAPPRPEIARTTKEPLPEPVRPSLPLSRIRLGTKVPPPTNGPADAPGASGPRYRARPALARIVGDQPMHRHEAANRLWAYIHERGLEDPEDKWRIRADDALADVFGGKESVSRSEMVPILTRHLQLV